MNVLSLSTFPQQSFYSKGCKCHNLYNLVRSVYSDIWLPRHLNLEVSQRFQTQQDTTYYLYIISSPQIPISCPFRCVSSLGSLGHHHAAQV